MVLYLPPFRKSDREARIVYEESLQVSFSPSCIYNRCWSLDSAFSSLKKRCLSRFLKGCLESRRMAGQAV